MAEKSNAHNQPPYLDIDLDPANLEISGPRLASLVRPDWVQKSIKFKELTDGLSNKLLAMFPRLEGEENLIVRIYGLNSDLIVDREGEIHTMTRLSQYNMSNRVLITFNNGFLYTFVPGDQMDINDENAGSMIAHKLAEFHSIPSDENSKTKSQLLEKINHYFNLLSGTNPDLKKRLESMEIPTKSVLSTIKTAIGLQSNAPSLESLESLLDYSWSQLKDDLNKIESTFDQHWSTVPIVYCHNDTQSRNFLIDKQTNTIQMIDFEHCFYNYHLFDIANYFVEFAGLDSSPNWKGKYPDEKYRKKFLTEYVKHARFLNQSDAANEIEKLCNQCTQLIAPIHLYWSLWAFLEAMLNPKSLEQFNYVEYGKSRFEQYKLHKNEFLTS